MVFPTSNVEELAIGYAQMGIGHKYLWPTRIAFCNLLASALLSQATAQHMERKNAV